MRRPLTAACLSFAFGIASAYYIKNRWIGVLLGAAAAVPCILRGRCALNRLFFMNGGRGKEAALLFLAAFCAGNMMMCAEMTRDPFELAVQEDKPFKQESAEIGETYDEKRESSEFSGRVAEAAQQEYSLLLTVKVRGKGKVRLTVPGGESGMFGVRSTARLVGRKIAVRGVLSLPQGRRNPGSFHYRNYLRARGVLALAEASPGDVRLCPDRSFSLGSLSAFAAHALAVLKEDFSGKIESAFAGDPETGGVLLGMLFGDRSAIGEETREAFQKSGTAHLLAVSGIHVDILYLYIRRVFRDRRDLPVCAATFVCLAVYAALSGFSPSAVRASLMIAANAASVVARRDYDMCAAASAAALLLLIMQPYRLFDTGFLLSFLSAFSLGVVLPWAEGKTKTLADRLKKEEIVRLGDMFLPLLVIQLVMIPVTAYFFQMFSWSSFFLNPLLIPAAGLIVPVGMALLPLSFLAGTRLEWIFFFGVNCAGIPAKMITGILRYLTGRGIGFFSVASPPAGFMICFYAALFFFCSESAYILRRKGGKRMAVAAFAGIIAFGSLAPFLLGETSRPGLLARADYPMVFVDVGQGDCLHIRTPRGKNILIDGGGNVNYNVGKKILAPYLLKNGVKKIDLAIATHLHSDHYRGLAELAGVLPVKRLAIYEGNRVREAEIRREWEGIAGSVGKAGSTAGETEICYVAQGDAVEADERVRITFLAPERRSDNEYTALCADESDENAESLVVKVEFEGLTVLMTGDLGFEGEEALLRGDERSGKQGEGTDSSTLDADILKVGHHGSKYSTSEEFLNAVDPAAAVIQVGKNNFGHPSPRVFALLQNYGIICYRTDCQGAVIVQSIRNGQAVLSDVRGEAICHINMGERGNTPIRHSKKN